MLNVLLNLAAAIILAVVIFIVIAILESVIKSYLPEDIDTKVYDKYAKKVKVSCLVLCIPAILVYLFMFRNIGYKSQQEPPAAVSYEVEVEVQTPEQIEEVNEAVLTEKEDKNKADAKADNDAAMEEATNIFGTDS